MTTNVALHSDSEGNLAVCIEMNFPLSFHQLPRSHRIILLKLLEKVCKDHIHELEGPLANDLIELASSELTKDPVRSLYSVYIHVRKLTAAYR